MGMGWSEKKSLLQSIDQLACSKPNLTIYTLRLVAVREGGGVSHRMPYKEFNLVQCSYSVESIWSLISRIRIDLSVIIKPLAPSTSLSFPFYSLKPYLALNLVIKYYS